ncbi:MAG: hypothetical protein U0V74_03385 [Chitinophagales bacterium]
MKIKSLTAVFCLFIMLASCQGGNKVDTTAIIGTWKWDVAYMKQQMIKNGHLKSDKKAIAQLDTALAPLEILRMEFKDKGVVLAHVDSVTTQDGKYEFIENNQFLKTEINGLPKYYGIKYMAKDKIILLETAPKSPVREFVLYPASQ